MERITINSVEFEKCLDDKGHHGIRIIPRYGKPVIGIWSPLVMGNVVKDAIEMMKHKEEFFGVTKPVNLACNECSNSATIASVNHHGLLLTTEDSTVLINQNLEDLLELCKKV